MAGAAAAIGSRALEFPDPAETASFAYRRFVRFAATSRTWPPCCTKLDDSDAAVRGGRSLPYARKTLERGVDAGRFDIVDVELALLSVSAAALRGDQGRAGRPDEPPTLAPGAPR